MLVGDREVSRREVSSTVAILLLLRRWCDVERLRLLTLLMRIIALLLRRVVGLRASRGWPGVSAERLLLRLRARRRSVAAAAVAALKDSLDGLVGGEAAGHQGVDLGLVAGRARVVHVHPVLRLLRTRQKVSAL